MYHIFFIPLAIYISEFLTGWLYFADVVLPFTQSILPVPLLDYFSDFLLLDCMNVLINLKVALS